MFLSIWTITLFDIFDFVHHHIRFSLTLVFTAGFKISVMGKLRINSTTHLKQLLLESN